MKRKVKLPAALLGAAALATTIQTVHPAEAHATSISTFDITHPAVIVNAEKIWFPDAQPFMDSSGRTQVPVRQITESLGATVKWDASTQTVDMQYQGKDIKLQVGHNTATVDGQTVSFDTSAQIVDGRTFVPLRFVTEALGATVKWYQPTQSVYVQTKSLDGVKLDPYSDRAIRTSNLPKNAGDFPFILQDTPNALYEYPKEINGAMGGTPEKDLYLPEKEVLANHWVQFNRSSMEALYLKAKHFYNLVTNVDYRTIDDNWAYAVAQYEENNVGRNPNDDETGLQYAMNYVRYVKAHKVIIKGFAEPELTVVGEDVNYNMEIHLHFEIDNYDKSDNGTGIPFTNAENMPDVFYCSIPFNILLEEGGYKLGSTVDTYGYASFATRLYDPNGDMMNPSTWYVDAGDVGVEFVNADNLLDYYAYQQRKALGLK